ncbi:cation:proton antiporter subunit C [Nesterenkonia sp. HG001]|uniref:sodium:proton antiporter n=1 Tax=Nesterenkonia sp. HG001 TaxID=2983207 RepID=UPI002ACC01D0|nr:cation:proton antiporter subunit C [Nesterenkonia sp. HG001]
MSIAIAIGVLTAAAVYLFMQRGMVRIVLGFVLASHAANLLLFSAGNVAYRGVPYIGSGEVGEQADPLPQAFVLTAIVIAFSITMFMVTLAITTTTDDDTENEEESPIMVLTGGTGDINDAGMMRHDIECTGAAGAGTGGAHASPLSPVHDFEGPELSPGLTDEQGGGTGDINDAGADPGIGKGGPR